MAFDPLIHWVKGSVVPTQAGNRICPIRSPWSATSRSCNSAMPQSSSTLRYMIHSHNHRAGGPRSELHSFIVCSFIHVVSATTVSSRGYGEYTWSILRTVLCSVSSTIMLSGMGASGLASRISTGSCLQVGGLSPSCWPRR